MRNFWKEPETKNINKKRIAITISTIILVITAITIGTIYVKNRNFREWFDTQILRKEVSQEKLTTIEIKEEESPQVHAYSQYIGVLIKNEFKIYGSTGKEEKKLNIEISNPIFASNNRYVAIAENKGKKLYGITDKDIAWETTVEGNISQVHVSKSGYVAITVSDTVNKTVIIIFNEKGEEQLKIFLSRMRVTDIAITDDNKYLAIAEIDTSGIGVESKIEVISTEKAKTDANNSKVATYTFENNEIITNIKYQNKNKLICMSKEKITAISLEGEKEELYNNENKKTIFQTVELSNSVAALEEKASDLFSADSIITIINTENKNISTYTANAVTKEIYTYEDIIALNLGTEIELINTGRLASKKI